MQPGDQPGEAVMSEDVRDQPGHFQSTVWSLVRRAGDRGDDLHRVSLEDLLTRYWPALRAHLVAVKRVDPHEADDLVQGFTRERVLEGSLLTRADRSRGKFRTLLLTALDHYVADQYRRRGAQKRQYETGAAGLEDRHGAGPPSLDTFDVEWARSTLNEALHRMQADCLEAGRPDLWGVFEARVLAETLGGQAVLPYDELVARFGFRSPAQASNALMTAKRTFARILRSILAEYAEEGDVETELRDLQQALARGAAVPR